jgi:hypothetical protein
MQTTLNAAALLGLEEFRGLEKHRDRHWQAHLEWLMERKPDLVRELDRLGKLGLWVDRVHQKAVHQWSLLEARMPAEEAWEVVYAEILAPAEDLDQAPQGRPLSESESRAIEARIR